MCRSTLCTVGKKRIPGTQPPERSDDAPAPPIQQPAILRPPQEPPDKTTMTVRGHDWGRYPAENISLCLASVSATYLHYSGVQQERDTGSGTNKHIA